MKITKYGHCCLLIEENGLRILTDPGSYSDLEAAEKLSGIDIVLITHEHQDHLHADSVKKILQNNPGAQVVTNTAVHDILKKYGVSAPIAILEHGGSLPVKGVMLEGFGDKHAPLIPEFPIVQNTGYFIANALFYPGDALTDPGKPVDILALPTAAPWMRVAESFEYARLLKPRIAFPVHDAILKTPGMFDGAFKSILAKDGINFHTLEHAKEFDTMNA